MKRILVVEDSKRIREIAVFALKNSGYHVDDVGDGSLAKHFINQNEYDLYILDVMLPGATGFELAEEIRSRNSSSKIMMLSAITQGTQITDEQMREKLGICAFMSKPFKIKELVEKVGEILNNS